MPIEDVESSEIPISGNVPGFGSTVESLLTQDIR